MCYPMRPDKGRPRLKPLTYGYTNKETYVSYLAHYRSLGAINFFFKRLYTVTIDRLASSGVEVLSKVEPLRDSASTTRITLSLYRPLKNRQYKYLNEKSF